MELNEIISRASEEVEKIRAQKKYSLDLNYEDFNRLISLRANKTMALRGISKDFNATPDQAAIIEQLFYYATGNSKFKGSLTKGIAILGPIGTGKTLLMNAFSMTFNLFVEKYNGIKWITARAIAQDTGETTEIFLNTGGRIQKDALTEYASMPIAIDDIGKEPLEVVRFGDRRRPITELIAKKYDNGSKLFFTSNFTQEELASYYGASIADRLTEMVNFIILKGKSLRR